MASCEDGGGWTMAERWQYHHAGYDDPEVLAAPKMDPIVSEKGFYSPSRSSGQRSISSTENPQNGLIPSVGTPTSNSSLTKGARRFFWTRKRIILAVIVIAVILGLAVAIPVTIIITRQQSAGSQGINGPALMENSNNWTLSTDGAYNGTGFATIIPPVSGDGQVILYAQHFNGELRQVKEADGHWTGGTTADIIVAADKIRAASPLSAIAYTNGGNETWRLVYVDQNDILQEITQVNRTGQWQLGSLGDLKLEASQSANAGLSLLRVRSGPDGFSDHEESSSLKPPPELRIHYAHKADNRIHELTSTGAAWTETFVFPADANANAGFVAAMPLYNLPLYFFASSAQNELLFYTQNATDNSYWTEAKVVTSSRVRSGSSMTFGTLDNLVIYQDASNNIVTVQPDLTDPNGTWGQPNTVDAAVGGTRISAKYYTNNGINKDYLYFQIHGDDLTQYSKTQNAPGSWLSTLAPID